MKFSVITPEHNPKNREYLIELYNSIKAQTHKDWEWILYLNNGMQVSDLIPEIISDPNVKIIVDNSGNSKIGFIKNSSFYCGSGDVLVEADHDDILTPDCLEKLNNVYESNSNIGFVYSDAANLKEKGEFKPYGAQHGWRYYKYPYNNKELISMRSFSPTSKSMAYIWYAPDHVRSWRKTVYHELGGHNKELSVCDDHDLCIRTYLHTKMYHIKETLYIYRHTGENTFLLRNQEIQKKTVELSRKYSKQLAEREARNRDLLLVDIGGGINSLQGYLTIDQEDADITCDLNNGIPLPDNSVGVLNASHIIEHLRDPIKTMSEIHRVLAHGGWAFIEVPSTDGRGAFQDPTHVSFWNENSFLYYTDQYMANFIRNKTIRFQSYRMETHFPNEWMKNLKVSVVSAWLVAIKNNEERFPGILKI